MRLLAGWRPGPAPTGRCRRPPSSVGAARRRSRSAPSGCCVEHLVDQPLGGRRVDLGRVERRRRPGVRSHTAYSTTRASARTAASTAGYDGTEPRPAVRAGDVGHPQQLGHALGAEERGDQRLVGLLADGGEHVGDVLAGDVERRDVDRDHRVDVGVVDRRVEGVLEVLGGGVGAERDRLVDHQPDRRGGVGGEQAERVGVADDRRPGGPRGSGWWASSWATSNISSSVSTWITPACRNIASTRLRRRRDLADRVAHRHALGGAAGPDRDDRLAQRDPAGDPGELARVADRLQVEQHDLGARRPPPSTAGGRCRRRRRGCRR